MKLSPIQARRRAEETMIAFFQAQGMLLPQAHALANALLIKLQQQDLGILHVEDMVDIFTADAKAKAEALGLQ